MEQKQTAVEWLEQQLNEKRLKHRFPLMNSEPLFEQAKEMEKEQIVDAATWGGLHESAEQYYKETYEVK